MLGWREVFSPIAHTTYPITTFDTGHGTIVQVRPNDPISKSIATGDEIDLSALSLANRIRLQVGSPVGTAVAIRIRHDGAWVVRTVEPRLRPIRINASTVTFLYSITVTLLLIAIIVARRPSMATYALVIFAGGSVTTFAVVAQFSPLPDPIFVVIATLIFAAFSEFPIFVLLVFLTRFPGEPAARSARTLMRLGDAIALAAAAAVVIGVIEEPVFFQSWTAAHNAYGEIGLALTFLFAITKYRAATGEDRQRIGWVLTGIIISQAALVLFNYFDSTPGDTAVIIRAVAFALQTAFPLALTYAILRFRVIDLGFVFNRTLVYAIVTAIVVVAVSFVDWLSSRLISETRLALAAEALVTIALGVALNALHGRVEHLVDRVIFRRRYIAEKKLRTRLEALAFATNERAIDLALTDEIVEILNLQSAAIFRFDNGGALSCTHATGWEPATSELDENSLLVRTIRAAQQPFFLADVGVTDPLLGTDETTPILAVPIERKQLFVGFALYGREADGTTPDPEIVAHLAELAGAAAATYELVEARGWRKRYTDLAQLVPPSVLAAE